MATTFLTPTARTEIIPTVASAWSNVFSLDSYVTVPVGATHVLLETSTTSTSGRTYGFQNGDDVTNYIYPSAVRFIRFDWIPLNTAKTLSLYTSTLSAVKFHIRAYSNHIVPVPNVDFSSSITNSTVFTLTCSTLPDDAAYGAAIFLNSSGDSTFGLPGTVGTLPINYHMPKQMEIVSLDGLKRFTFAYGTNGQLAADKLVLIGYIPAGRYVTNKTARTEKTTLGAVWADAAKVDLLGAMDVWRIRTNSSSVTLGVETGGHTGSIPDWSSVNGQRYSIPNATTGKTAFYTTGTGSNNDLFLSGYFMGTYTDKLVGYTDTFARNQITTLRADGLNSIKSARIGTLFASDVTGSNGLFTCTFPDYVNGQVYPAYGSYSVAITDGTTTVNGTASLTPRYDETAVTITDVSATGPGYLQYYMPLAVGDVVTFRTGESLNVLANDISSTGVISTDYVGLQAVWIRNNTTGVMTKVNITSTLSNNIADVFTFQPVKFAALSTTYTSNTITVSGLGNSQTASVSIVGGLYSKNGGAYTATGGLVANGDTVVVQVTSPAALGLSTKATVSLGPNTSDFVIYSTPLYAIPDAFTFTNQTGVATSATATSNTVTIAGIAPGVDVPISIVGGTYSKNGGAYTSTAGTITVGDTLTVRQVASATIDVTTTATVTIANVNSVWTVTTSAAVIDTTPDSITFIDQVGVPRSSTIESNSITVAGVDAGQDIPISITGGQYAVNSGSGFGAFTSASSTVQLGYVVKVNLTSSSAYNTGASATLNIGSVSDTFTAITAVNVATVVNSYVRKNPATGNLDTKAKQLAAVVVGSLAGLKVTAYNGFVDGGLIKIESSAHTFQQPDSFNYLGFGTGWLYDQPLGVNFKDLIVTTPLGNRTWDYEGSAIAEQRYIHDLDGIRYLRSDIWSSTGNVVSSGGGINWYVGRPTVTGDRLIQYSRGRCTVNGAGATENGSFQLKDERQGAYANLEVNVNNSAYLKSYGNGQATINTYDYNEGAGEVHYTRGINKKGAHYTQLWQWKINTPDVADGGHIVYSKRDDVSGGLIAKTAVLNPMHIQTAVTERPCFIKWQQYCGNRGNNGTETLQTDVEWLNTDFFAQLNGSMFVIAADSVLTASTDMCPLIPIKFDSTGRWWLSFWKGKITTITGTYLHLLDADMNSVASQQLG